MKEPPIDREPWLEASRMSFRKPRRIVISSTARAFVPEVKAPETETGLGEWDAWVALYNRLGHESRRKFFQLQGDEEAKKAFLMLGYSVRHKV